MLANIFIRFSSQEPTFFILAVSISDSRFVVERFIQGILTFCYHIMTECMTDIVLSRHKSTYHENVVEVFKENRYFAQSS